MKAERSREYVVLVDEQDNELGFEEKMTAHRRGLCHRAFSIMIFRNSRGRIEGCMQRRSPDKYHCGGLWSNTCCSHPRRSENLESAAHRRLWEEMGMKCELFHVGKFHYLSHLENGLIENEVDHVFIGLAHVDRPAFDKSEIAETAWWPLEAVEKRLQREAAAFTPWFTKVFELATGDAGLKMIF